MGNERVVVIVGGGYAGVLCANRLRSSLGPDEMTRTRIVLVTLTSTFVERIRLHEVAAGSRADAGIAMSGLVHPDVELQLGRAVRVDAHRHLVDVETDGSVTAMPYDRLVYAVGSGPDRSVPGVAEFALGIADAAEATAAHRAIVSAGAGARVVVVGGGFTGVETASEVAEQNPDASVTLLSSGALLGSMRPAAQRSIRRRLTTIGVSVRENCRVEQVTATGAVLDTGEEVPFDVCLWTASFSVPELARTSGLSVDGAGRLLVDEHLQSIDSPDIIGAGDAVRLPDSVGAHVRMGCAMALPLGGAAAHTVLSTLRGETPPVVSVGFLFQCISLGRTHGYIQVVRADDSPRPLALGGRFAALVKEAICRMTVNRTRKEQLTPGAYWSPRGPQRRQVPHPAPQWHGDVRIR
ncbi:NADH dehydrogenase FAD-containing subunit [Okibacterium sp. HSC-33S16]|uniref:NAD(P)/FAD-dependent oxidoreductase n=1 Tax=Okibacterium sp. HSC-33S16 TaxID=2910965 RepID=UPI0020A1B1D9|nr:FAD-dependent oxidoreductase [Okibacterium sp. HSC-33S16]MCP2032679.1 NADH dehydrogenase FAD-containing subunit [Okibacterium sp. HSC-33S16]